MSEKTHDPPKKVPGAFVDQLRPSTKDCTMVNAILVMLGQQNMTVAEAKTILYKARQAIDFIAFSWNDEVDLGKFL